MTLLTQKIVKNGSSKLQKLAKLTKNLDFPSHLETFWAENNPKNRLYKFKNNAQKFPKQMQNNFEKVQKITFRPSKLPKHRSVRPPQ